MIRGFAESCKQLGLLVQLALDGVQVIGEVRLDLPNVKKVQEREYEQRDQDKHAQISDKYVPVIPVVTVLSEGS